MTNPQTRLVDRLAEKYAKSRPKLNEAWNAERRAAYAAGMRDMNELAAKRAEARPELAARFAAEDIRAILEER